MISVLLVDDELLMRIGLKSMINWEERGFHVIGEAANGKEALEIARRQPPDVIITDIKMPIMDGLELIREATLFLHKCQYVILSCMDEFQYAKEALRLGAADYLIKSDIKQQHLIDVLDTIKKNIDKTSLKQHIGTNEQYKQSITYLKETLFKEVLSGFRKEEDVVSQMGALSIRVRPEAMVVLKLKVDQFETIRMKYVEKDERLLRYAVVNILEEMIPRKWSNEIIVENSAEYLIVMNTQAADASKLEKADLNRLLEKVMSAMKDFLNISISIGVSPIISSFNDLRAAYQEAEIALANHFFEGAGKVIYYEEAVANTQQKHNEFVLDKDEERAFKLALESHDYNKCQEWMEELQKQMHLNLVSERVIRQIYIRVLEWIRSHFPSTPDLIQGSKTSYEQLLKQETFGHIHEFAKKYFDQCIRYSRMLIEDPPSYVDQAISIIMKHYTEDLSLQAVAGQINVNPSYLSRIFKQETGENFINFLTKVRIDNAKHYLETSNCKVYEVAVKVGYQNTTYFSKIFKKVVGVTPEKYRG